MVIGRMLAVVVLSLATISAGCLGGQNTAESDSNLIVGTWSIYRIDINTQTYNNVSGTLVFNADGTGTSSITMDGGDTETSSFTWEIPEEGTMNLTVYGETDEISYQITDNLIEADELVLSMTIDNESISFFARRG